MMSHETTITLVLCFGIIPELYSIFLHVINFLKKKRMSDVSMLSGYIFLYADIYGYVNDVVSGWQFLFFLFLIIFTRYVHMKISGYCRNKF
jgi:hypothetical protein